MKKKMLLVLLIIVTITNAILLVFAVYDIKNEYDFLNIGIHYNDQQWINTYKPYFIRAVINLVAAVVAFCVNAYLSIYLIITKRLILTLAEKRFLKQEQKERKIKKINQKRENQILKLKEKFEKIQKDD